MTVVKLTGLGKRHVAETNFQFAPPPPRSLGLARRRFSLLKMARGLKRFRTTDLNLNPYNTSCQ